MNTGEKSKLFVKSRPIYRQAIMLSGVHNTIWGEYLLTCIACTNGQLETVEMETRNSKIWKQSKLDANEC